MLFYSSLLVFCIFLPFYIFEKKNEKKVLDDLNEV